MTKANPVHVVTQAGKLLFLVLCFWAEGIFAEPVKCAGEDVTVHAELRADIAPACSAAGQTYDFLRSAGLVKPVSIEIYIVTQLSGAGYGDGCLGSYDPRSQSVYILSYKTCECRLIETGFWGLTFNREVHKSFIVHEVAHAIAHAHFTYQPQSIAAQEYIPSTTQIALMHEDKREELLSRIPNDAFDGSLDITSMFYDLSPSVFAVKAYRHFIRSENGVQFYQKLLSGAVQLNGDE